MRIIKKIIILAITVVLLGLQILIPIDLVQAQQTLTDEEAFSIGSLLTGSQGGQTTLNEAFYQKMTDLGNSVVNNALQNGKRFTDIIQRNGNELLFNPNSVIDVIGNTWNDFAAAELSWITSQRATYSLGTDGIVPANTAGDGFSRSHTIFEADINEIGFEPQEITFTGINLNQNQISYSFRGSTTTGNFSRRENILIDNNILNISSTKYETVGLYRLTDTFTGSTQFKYINRLDVSRPDGFNDLVQVNRLVLYRDRAEHEGLHPTAHIPDETPPSIDNIEMAFSSTFSEMIDEETGEYIDIWYNYDITEIYNSSTVVNNHYVTNNYHTEIHEGDTTIIHEADEEGGGTFWGALLELLGTIVSSFANLGSSIADAIGQLFEPLFSFLTNIFDWLTWFEPAYIESNIETIQSDFTDKFPDFTEVIDTDQTISNEVPDMTVNFSFMGLGEQQVMDISMFEPYIPYLKNILRAFLYLTTAVIVFIKITGGGLND